MPHTILEPALASLQTLQPPDAPSLPILGPEAHHAVRVKRLAVGDRVHVTDGQGRFAPDATIAAISKDRDGAWRLTLTIHAIQQVAPARPLLTIAASPPKADRLEAMIDALTQLGATAYAPLRTARGEADADQASPTRAARLLRHAQEALKQCRRAHLLRLDGPMSLDDGLALAQRAGHHVLVADASGPPLLAEASGPALRAVREAEEVTVLVGPEGGFTPQELAQVRDAMRQTPRLHVHALGPHVLRIETAALAACAILRGHAAPTP